MTNRDYLSKVGLEIKIARIRKGLTISEVCDLTGMDEHTVSDIERGKNDARILTYKRVAEVLKVELKDVF